MIYILSNKRKRMQHGKTWHFHRKEGYIFFFLAKLKLSIIIFFYIFFTWHFINIIETTKHQVHFLCISFGVFVFINFPPHFQYLFFPTISWRPDILREETPDRKQFETPNLLNVYTNRSVVFLSQMTWTKILIPHQGLEEKNPL